MPHSRPNGAQMQFSCCLCSIMKWHKLTYSLCIIKPLKFFFQRNQKASISWIFYFTCVSEGGMRSKKVLRSQLQSQKTFSLRKTSELCANKKNSLALHAFQIRSKIHWSIEKVDISELKLIANTRLLKMQFDCRLQLQWSLNEVNFNVLWFKKLFNLQKLDLEENSRVLKSVLEVYF